MISIDRRNVLKGAVALGAITVVPSTAFATPDTMTAAMAEALGGVAPKPGRIKLDISPLAENGNSVPLTITVESPMSATDHVKTIYLFSPENPQPDVARFHIGPRAGRAQVKTSIRLATSQHIHGIAVMSDGSVWSDSAEVIVTLSACIDAG
ncbi:MAG: SoxY-related AACIE arm protein [Hyphomicrobiaceae bacterium]